MGNFGIKIDLLKLKNSFVTNLKGKAATKRCLVIPIDDSGVYLGEKGVYLNLTAVEMREQRYGDTHVLKQSLAKVEKTVKVTPKKRRKMTPKS